MEWRAIPDWPAYEVSDTGFIKRVADERATYVGKILKSVVGTNGYEMLSLSCNGRIKRFCVHTLVCRAFHGTRPSSKHVVAHADGNRLNNVSSNLRWATYLENERDKDRHGSRPRGDNHRNAKITDEQRAEIRRRWNCSNFEWGEKALWMERTAVEFGMRPSGIKEIVKSRRTRT